MSLQPRTMLSRALLAALLGLLVLATGAQAASSPFGALSEQGPIRSAGVPPVLNTVGAQASTVGTPATVTVTGEHLDALDAAPLPSGMSLEKVSTSEWKIVGTPKAPQPATVVTIKAENEEATAETSFEWTIEKEAPAVINVVADQTSTVGIPVNLIVTGERLHTLTTVQPLPEGLKLKQVSETEWKVEGTPTVAKAAVSVTLVGRNAEPGPVVTLKFEWTIDEAQPVVNPVSNQTSTVGLPVNLVITGERLHTLTTAAPLPEGLKLKQVSETEWKIEGTPTVAKAAVTVTLEAQNGEGVAVVTATFKWTITAQAAAINPVPDQTAIVGTGVSLAVTGERMAFLTAIALPEGLALESVSESEWRIVGTPTTAKAPVTVTLEARNAEKLGSATRVFKWTVAAPVPAGPAPSGALAIAPALVFSAAKSECGGVTWPVNAVSTQWLIDGTTVASATAATFVPPRAEDGHQLSCRQTATAPDGATTTVTSPSHTVYEQPAQPVWPIALAAQRCQAAVCMQDGGTAAIQSAQSYAQSGQWMAARQVRCASAPWTSQAGDSALASIHRLAAAHEVRVSLQRISTAGTVTLLTEQVADEAPTAAFSPFAGNVALPFGAQRFAAGELWTRIQPSALGTSNWFAAGAGALFYATSAKSGVARSFQLVYNLTAADLGARLRCVAGADDGPPGSPTRAEFLSPEYSVATAASCAPRRLAAITAPQPALLEPGRAPCLLAPAGPLALEGNQASIAVARGKAVIALSCALASNCRGTLAIGAGTVLVGKLKVSIAHGRSRLVRVPLSARGRRLLSRSHAGVAVALTLKTHAAKRRLGVARLQSVG